MIDVSRVAEVREHLDRARAGGRTVGFVPTMGALHEGHLSLIRRARAETGVVVVSIFVNPTQFGPHEDFHAYPRPVGEDLEACRIEGVDLVFRPPPEEMYPQPPLTRVVVGGLSEPMEGRHRPGHLEGVAIVCTKLFSIVGPCRAYFGEKDAQQLRVIRRLAQDLNLPVDVVGCPTVREADGLALSSRNVYLGGDERRRALALPRALHAIADEVSAGERDVARLLARGHEVLREGTPDAIDYLECVHPDTLEGVARVEGGVLVCGAIRIGRTRLIDNVLVGPEGAGVRTTAGEHGASEGGR